jgi:hypothetical protein
VVVKDLLRGYRLNGRIARASRVIVGEYKGELAVPPAEVAEAPTEPIAAAPEPPPEEEERLLEPSELSLDEIIARAEAQEALFPDAFEREKAGAEDEDQKT